MCRYAVWEAFVRSRPRILAALALALGLVLLAACSSSTETLGATTRAVTSAAGSSTSDLPTSNPPSCPNSEGGACLGPLAAKTVYTTTVFDTPITYSVPATGWFNYEDTPGNFLLVPPGSDLAGVNAGTSDFVGVYRAIAASSFSSLPSCATELVAGVAQTPRAIVAWMRLQAALSVAHASHVTVGGLHGVVTDVRVRAGARLPTCQDGVARITVFVLFSGVPPSSLDHGVIRGMTMRLYLLAVHHQVLCIELDDIHKAPGDLVLLSTVATRLRFRT